MKTKVFIFLFWVLAVGARPAVNPYRFAASGTDWTADAALMALYLTNTTPGLNQDSTAKGNHIDDGTVIEAPAANSSDKIEDGQSADVEVTGNDDGFILTYANATADFPCNGTGDGEVTFAGWVKPESLPAAGAYLIGINAGVQAVTVATSGSIAVTFNGTGAVTLNTTATLATGNWYFVAGIYSDVGNEVICYIRQQGAGSSTWETTAATIGTLDSAGASTFGVGCRLDGTSAVCWDGLMDAWAVFNGKAFTQAELDGVFANGWDGNGW